jgi:hypothetical protein
MSQARSVDLVQAVGANRVPVSRPDRSVGRTRICTHMPMSAHAGVVGPGDRALGRRKNRVFAPWEAEHVIKAVFLADHADIYDGRLFVTGGVVDQFLCGALPDKVRLEAVALVDASDVPDRRIDVRLFLTDPAGDGIYADVVSSYKAVTNFANSVVCVRTSFTAELEGRHILTARYADAVDGGASVAFIVVDDARAW